MPASLLIKPHAFESRSAQEIEQRQEMHIDARKRCMANCADRSGLRGGCQATPIGFFVVRETAQTRFVVLAGRVHAHPRQSTAVGTEIPAQ